MSSSSFRILVVEDQPDMSRIIRETVSRLRDKFPDAEIEAAYNLQEAVSLVMGDPPFDVTFLDLNLPDSTMEQTIQKIAFFEEHTAVVLITGYRREMLRKLLHDQGIEIIEKGPELFEPSLFTKIADTLWNQRNRKMSEDRIKRGDEIASKLREFKYGDEPGTQ